jgi:putative transposase
VNLNDLGIKVKMRGQAKQWGKPTTLTIVYKPGLKQWFASFTVEVSDVAAKFGSQSELAYNSKRASKELRRKQAPNRNKKTKASQRWKKANKRVARLQRSCWDSASGLAA